ncbi:MAG: phosphodiester glycosidase family protein [Candidatus Hydrogenedentes bacterium]|nr:phosphodiester glycosidase family protein [Candidatus Hydrogenedentota bacterium]
MNRLRKRASVFLLIGLATSVGADALHPFPGVELAHIQTASPEPVSYFVVKVDMTLLGLRFTATAPNGDGPRDTWTETTREFVQRTGSQIGINASFFANDGESHTDILSLSVSNGVPYSPWKQSMPCGINISEDNTVTFIEPAIALPTGYECNPSVTLYNAIAGNLWLVRNGKNVTAPEGKRHPRTAIGITRDNKLVLLVVDGRAPSYSVGMTCHELAETLLRHDAVDALNLDGGGSSTLVIADPEPRVVNIPMPIELPDRPGMTPHAVERKVGNNLGILVPRGGGAAGAEEK